MTKRTRFRTSAPESRVVALLAQEQINLVLDTLSEREAGVISMRYGLLDEEPKTLHEIALVYGVTRERIAQIERKAMEKLKHASRSAVLDGYLDGDGLAAVYRHLGSLADRGLVRCPRHGWVDKPSAPCLGCPCSVGGWNQDLGRPRRYCSDACRQAAYRRRRAAARSRSST